MTALTIAISPRSAAYAPDLLRSLGNQDFDKRRLHLFIDVAGADAATQREVRAFCAALAEAYGHVEIVAAPGGFREACVRHAIANDTGYAVIDQNIVLHPGAITRLHRLGLPVVAPMLVSDGVYSNFHAQVDDNGYYRDGPLYHDILSRRVAGILDVPVVNGCYLVDRAVLRHVRYDDGTRRDPYVVFSDGLRRQSIPQYVDNTFNYGIILNYEGRSADEIRDIDSRNNKAFFLAAAGRGGKAAFICDADWLFGYVAAEHYHLIRLLQDEHGFHIVNCHRLSFSGPEIVDDLDRYTAIVLGYHGQMEIPVHRISARRIYRIDDLTSYDGNYNRIVAYHIRHADTVISPYAYAFAQYHAHHDVRWVPYSSCLDGCDRDGAIGFNETPKNRILLSGNIRFEYPFREYVAGLDHDAIDRIPHPGYGRHEPGGSALVRRAYFEKLNEYLCCFTDSLTFGYVLLKNFEIASVGSLLLTDRAIEAEMNELGFVDGETCLFCDRNSFLERVAWILDAANRPAVDRIRRRGMMLVRERHLTRHRARQIADLVDGGRPPRADPAPAPPPDPIAPAGVRLFTAHGTVVFVDAASGEVRHGPLESSPANIVLVGDGDRGLHRFLAAGDHPDVACTATFCALVGSALARGGEPQGVSGTALARVPVDARAFGLTEQGRYLCAEPDGRLTLSRPECRLWEQFHTRIDAFESSGTIMSHRIDGQIIRFFITSRSDWIQSHLCRGDFYERPALDLMKAHIRPQRAFVDVGANIGNHAIFVARYCTASEIVVFEPNPAAIRLLRINLALNGCGNVDTSHLGVALGADRRRLRVLQPASDNLGGAPKLAEDAEGEIRCIRGDDVLLETPVGFLKIDVEGMEFPVLAGLSQTIDRWRPAILVEVWSNAREALADWCGQSGYDVARTVGDDNYLLLPKERR